MPAIHGEVVSAIAVTEPGGSSHVAVSDTCIQLQGGFGYMKESAAGRGYVDLRLISIGDGADEVMIQYLAKMLDL